MRNASTMQITDVEKEFNALKSQLKGDNRKYYHLSSIENFIENFHLVEFESKEFVIDSLAGCITYYKTHAITDMQHSAEVFYRYLRSVGKIYEEQAGFSVLIKPWIMASYIGFALLLIYLLNFHLVFNIVCTLLVIRFMVYLFVKYRKRKLYAFFW